MLSTANPEPYIYGLFRYPRRLERSTTLSSAAVLPSSQRRDRLPRCISVRLDTSYARDSTFDKTVFLPTPAFPCC